MTTETRNTYAHLIALAIALLCFLDLGAAFIEAAYAFGLLATEVPPAVALVALAFIAPLALVPFRRPLPKAAFVALLVFAIGCRVVEPMLQRMPRVIVAGLGFGVLLSLLPVWITRLGRQSAGPTVAGALALACAAAALTRVGGVDASRHLPLAALPLLAVALVSWKTEEPPPAESTPVETDASFPRTLGLVLGLTCALALALSAFMAPGVMARWFYLSHLGVHAMVGVSWAAALALLVFQPQRLGRVPLAIATLAFAVALTMALFTAQPSVASYPSKWLPSSGIHVWPRIALLLSGTVPLAAGAIAGELRAAPRRLAIAFGLGGLLLLLLVAAQILTTIYDYVPVVGSLFRNRFWIVTALPALGLAASTLLVRTPPSALPRGALAPLLALAVLGIAGSRVTEPAPAETAPVSKQSLRVVSYNIQQGYAKDGRKDLDAQLALIKELDADVVGLQECDTSRLAGGNADTVRYLANALGMHAYYGPSPPAGTFGVAVLSRHPITAVATHYLESTGEQTVLVVADVAVGQKNYSVAVTHLGNDGPLVQQQNVLAALPERGVILMGDFNFVPGSPQHRLTLAKLADAWDTAGEGERRPDEIDHLFVSRDLRVRAMRYRREPASDHPALFGEL